MTRKEIRCLTGMIVTCAATFAMVASTHAQDLSGIKCVVNGDLNASPDASIEYQDGRVYVCCEECIKQFEADPAAFATRANHQLVLTGQYRQSKCPINDTDFDPDVTANVGGTSIAFCCQSCLKKVDDAETMSDRAELVFGDKAFKKSFVKVESDAATSVPEIDLAKVMCLVEPDREVSEKYAADHLEGKVFFCCKQCAKDFKKDSTKLAAAANRQLVQTGQYVQTKCPLVGGPVSDDIAAVVGGVSVKLCCEKCIAAIEKTKTDEEKVALVFEPARFAKSFKLVSTQTQFEIRAAKFKATKSTALIKCGQRLPFSSRRELYI